MLTNFIIALITIRLTNGMNKMNLPTNGSYRLAKTGNILIVNAQGPFNDITVNQYLTDIKVVIEDIKHAPWATLAIFTGNGVFTPEAEQALIDITRHRIKNNMVAIATVIKQSHQADLQQMQLTRIYQSCNIIYNFFAGDISAKLWLDDFLNNNRAVG